MRFFRVRLILALIASVTLVSAASTYFDVLAHRHILREDLERRAKWMDRSIQPDIQSAMAAGDNSLLPRLADSLKSGTGALALALYDSHGNLMASSGPPDVMSALTHNIVEKALQKGVDIDAFGHAKQWQWLEQVTPIHNGDSLQGAMALVVDASYIRAEGISLWQRSFWRIVALVILIVGITVGMVRWFLLRPVGRVAERLRWLRTGHGDKSDGAVGSELGLFSPLAREVETMAESLRAARASAAAEARLREAGEQLWTAERLAVHIRNHAGSSRIFVVSNREPYMHIRRGREITCVVPPSGLVTALEPVLRACNGVWVASGSGDGDSAVVDDFDRLRVPPDEPLYTLRRVWLSEREEAMYYEGFSNEGLWPLCHIAHTRPIFRAADWECYQRVNRKFADALLEEMRDSEEPVVFVQDYHLALVPQLVKKARPDARVAIFWHIPWPNPEAFGICPWQAELLDGLLGADLIGFHISLHCNNFLATVDRVLESRIDREHMTVRRQGHNSLVRPYPVSVAFDGVSQPLQMSEEQWEKERAAERQQLLSKFGVRVECLALGVDRLDYTKGIVERLDAIEQFFEDHPWYRERLTMVQIAAPSRTRIPSYAELKIRVEDTVQRINTKYQTMHWKPIVLIEEQYNHQQVNRWYRAADLCLVTSLHDGMNLVAKEFVAARDDEDGVLVLSKFTGAAVELRDALLVNPYDTTGVADAIFESLEMPLAERRDRMRRMRRHVMQNNIYMWAAQALGDLREVRIEDATAGRLAPAAVPFHEVEEEKTA
jgi:alpha,alpha-trehalose-phosphate synthase [UDP-forming]